MKKISSIFLMVISLSAFAQSTMPEVEAVRQYLLENDYPELFGNQPYRMNIQNAIVADLDADGIPEVILHVRPHYRQSATILIFRVTQSLRVTRVMESLAPGPLLSVSGDQLDSHMLGQAVDFTVAQKKGESINRNELIAAAIASKFGGIVEYTNFIHGDGRIGFPTYIDMTQSKLPIGANTCGSFEFSPIIQIEVGTVSSSDGRNVIAAVVGKEIWVYQINHFLSSGLLEKNIAVYDAPKNLISIVRNPEGGLELIGGEGSLGNLGKSQSKLAN